jgi:DnaJ-class molecular chaperone
MSDNFYNILEVPETAGPDEIKKSYRRLSMLHHPDKNGNSDASKEKFQKISEAYEVLGDAEKKQEYDMTRNNPFIKMMSSPNGATSGSVDELFSTLFGMPFFTGGNPVHLGHMGNPGNPGHMGNLGSNVRIFHNGMPVNMNMGFGQQPGQPFMQKPAAIMATIVVPIDKILVGTTVPIDIERWIIENGNKVFEHEMVYVTIPKGIDEGEILLLQGKGNVASETNKGDIKIFVKVENNTPFKRSGLDLILEKTITVKDALCGFSFELKYLTGKVYTITNNSGNIISHGYKKMIPNMGFEREGHKGNLIILFDVQFPEKLAPETIEALKAIPF